MRQKGSYMGRPKRGEPDPTVNDRRVQMLQEEFIICFIKEQRRLYNRVSEDETVHSFT